MAMMKLTNRARSGVCSGSLAGMTVMELLIVISIIALLSALAVPAIRALTRSNTISSANRQLLDDFALARQRAINERSVVHIVFVPTWDELNNNKPMLLAGSERNKSAFTNIWAGAQIRYALYAERSAGDQPGQHHPRYLTGWHTLPEGVFIPERELNRLERMKLPFPTVEGQVYGLPHIAFNFSGAVVDQNGAVHSEGAFLELARGSILVSRDASGAVTSFDARENPPNNSVDNFNRVRVDGLTGRARVEQPQIQ
jgi:type II secretory pathway pseudopilin PulG